MLLRQIFDPYLAQYAYLIGCQKTGEAIVIDPERDIDRYRQLAAENNLRVTAVAETHIHADFVSGAQEFAVDPGIKLYLSGEGGADWSYKWPLNRAGTTVVRDGDIFSIGKIEFRVVHTPGHTPEHISFLVTDRGGGAAEPMALITGDFLFVGDVGRPDLLESAAGMKNVMEPSARTLQHSLAERLSPFADFMQILPAHGAGSACGKSLGAVPTSTLGYERRFNQPLRLAQSDEQAFVKDILQGQPDPPLYFATMKRVNRDGIQVTGAVPRGRKYSAAEVAKLIQSAEVKVIDARMDRSKFDKGHIAAAIYAPLHTPFFTAAVGSFLTEDTAILLVLDFESDLDLAARQLYRIGIDGLKGWILADDAASAGLMQDRAERIEFPDFNPGSAAVDGKIIDVRTSAEFASGHLQGALSIPYTRLRERLEIIPKDKVLYVHCASGKRAALASSYLKSLGYKAVHVEGSFASCGKRGC